MIEGLALVFGVVALLGAVAAMIQKDPFDKLVSLGILGGGIVPFIVDRGYLDVAIAYAFILPIATIFILLVCRRRCP